MTTRRSSCLRRSRNTVRPTKPLLRKKTPHDHTVEITWRLKQRTRDMTAGSFIRGVLFGRVFASNVKDHISEKVGIYFLCEECNAGARGKWKKFWNEFVSLRPSEEFQIHTVRECELFQSETGTKLE